MTTDELKEALRSKRPVIVVLPQVSGGDIEIECECVSAIICRNKDFGRLYISAEVLDKKARTTYIVKPEQVKEVLR